MIRISYNVQRYYFSTIYTKFMIKKARKADFAAFRTCIILHIRIETLAYTNHRPCGWRYG